MFGECSCSYVDGILIDGAFSSMEVDIGESAKTTALGATASYTRETAMDGGVKYLSNIGYFVVDSERFLCGHKPTKIPMSAFASNLPRSSLPLVG
ncbi:hypothetical protein Tco_1030653 [Tanacetum coccineum]|uniref:Uncharacterized protein n=1 Tax=Tanacetum coccineum TaxID=301880 RepID=A0ABQ5G8P2_9ASTR